MVKFARKHLKPFQNLANFTMKPRSSSGLQATFFNPWLDAILNQEHELIHLAKSIPWIDLEKEFFGLFTEKTGAPAKPVRLVVGLLMLQHMYGHSDERVVEAWIENPYWQFFCGYERFEKEQPIDPSSLVRWRKRLGADGMTKMLQATIVAALDTRTISEKSLLKAIVDTTVMEKNIVFPTDARLHYRAIFKLAKMAKDHGVELRQSYVHIGKRKLTEAARYSHARQMKRAKKAREKLKTYLGRLVRDIERKIEGKSILEGIFKNILEISKKLLSQTKESKNKIYSIHEPHVECISKGKAHKKYEFGCKASFVITHKEGLVISSMALHGTPYDGHTLSAAIKDAENNSGKQLDQVYVDKGYKGHKIEGKSIFISGQRKGITGWFKKQMKRRQAIEPQIGHMKSDGKLDRNFLSGKIGDKLNAILCGVGHNMRMILRCLKHQLSS